ncbi:aminophospholipid-transporting P-type ATPase [Boletus coccyginus]|nr:aminophospholipid-transporting P-type ATPase [Boletus coccyginus]
MTCCDEVSTATPAATDIRRKHILFTTCIQQNKRHQSDSVQGLNAVIAPSSIFESRKWRDIRFIPADLVLISSSEPVSSRHETKLMRNATREAGQCTHHISLWVSPCLVRQVHHWCKRQYDILTFIILYNNFIPISLIVTLGQIEFIFSDKTGTLSRNEVEFSVSIGGVVYAEEVDKSRKADTERDEEGVKESWRMFDDRRRVLDGTSTSGKAPKNPFSAEAMAMSDGVLRERVMALLAACHTVIPEVRDGKTHFQASDPDEAALYHFNIRKSKSVFVYIQGQTVEYETLNVWEFNSTRKRMSTVSRPPSVRKRGQQQGEQDRLGHGTTSSRRNKALDQAAELIEKGIFLLGATVTEDKQEGVPDTIHTLQEAGIKIWVLTGDRQETAINIGENCRLAGERMNLMVANEETARETAEFIGQRQRLGAIGSQGISGDSVLGGLTTRDSLMFALEKEVFKSFLELALFCKAIICYASCRVSPLQKALVVKLAKKNQNSIWLVIGYGANDTRMIQAAHVGVGISGVEVAARSADIVISQFRSLKKLLMHGTWSYQLILHSFHKNMTLYVTQFWIAYESWTISFYNVIFTVLPPLVMGIFDQFVSAHVLNRYPQLYASGKQECVFTKTAFWLWIGNALYHSLILVGFLVILFWGDLKQLTALYLTVLLTVLGKAALISHLWTKYNVAAIPGSFVFTMVFLPPYALDLAWKYYKQTYDPRSYHVAQEVQKYNVLDYRPRQAQFQKAIKKVRAVQRTKRNAGFAFNAGGVGGLDQTAVIGAYGMAGVKPTGY